MGGTYNNMEENKYHRFIKRTEEELKKNCADEFAYQLVKSFPIYQDAWYRSVPFHSKMNFDKMIISLNYSSPMNNELIGIFVPNGWQNLVWELSEKLTLINPELRVLQVKEKFGELRFIYSQATDEQHELILIYKQLSRKTCMRCGKTSDEELIKQKGGWVITICGECEGK